MSNISKAKKEVSTDTKRISCADYRKTKNFIKSLDSADYFIKLSVTRLDYDGFSYKFFIVEGYENGDEYFFGADSGFGSLVRKLQKHHLALESTPEDFYIREVRNHNKDKKDAAFRHTQYQNSVSWVIDSGPYFKLYVNVSLYKKKVGLRLKPIHFKSEDDYDVSYFFDSPEVLNPFSEKSFND